MPWNRTGVDSTVVKLTIGMLPGDEEFALSCGGYGDEPGKMIWTAGIALDSRENVYATDEWMNRVSVFDKEGSLQGIWGTTGSEEGELLRPSGIAVDAQDDVYIADSLNHRIQKFTKEGKFLAKWGSRGSGEGELDSPWGIRIDAQGYVYVADHKNHRPRSSHLTGSGWLPSAATAPAEGSWTALRTWRWTPMVTCTCVTGPTAGSRFTDPRESS